MAESSLIYLVTPQTFTPKNSHKSTYTIGSRVSETETRHKEYKLGKFAISNLEEHIQKYGSAFLNSGGGTLTLGIADDGIVVGIYARESIRARIRQTIEEEFRLFKPPVSTDFYEIDFVPTCTRDRYVLEIHVRAGAIDEIYVGKNDKMYIRRDGSVQGPLWPQEIKDIVLTKFKQAVGSDKENSKLVSLIDSTPVLDRAAK